MVSAWCTRYLCTAALLLLEVQQVQVAVADGLLSRDFEGHTVCNPGSLLVVLLQLLLFDVSHLFLLVSAINPSWLLYTGSSGCPTASGPPGATVASELWVLSLLISVCSGSSVRISKLLSRG